MGTIKDRLHILLQVLNEFRTSSPPEFIRKPMVFRGFEGG